MLAVGSLYGPEVSYTVTRSPLVSAISRIGTFTLGCVPATWTFRDAGKGWRLSAN